MPPRSDRRPTAETSNGTIAVTAPRGQLSLVSSNARIGIAATDAAVRASSANGEIAFAGSLATGPHSFGTSNAAIALHLGADATFSLDLETSNAKVAVGYPVTTSETASETRLAGRVGVAPAIAISARTSNGGITILPAKEGLEGNRLASSELYRLRMPSSTDCGCRARLARDHRRAYTRRVGGLPLPRAARAGARPPGPGGGQLIGPGDEE